MSENLYLYILIRTDLGSMGSGRACAQCSHASNAFIKSFGKMDDVVAWSSQTPQGFGTAIVLGASLDQIFEKLYKCGKFYNELIYDPDYVITIPKEIVYLIKSDKETPYPIKLEPSLIDVNKYILHRKEITCAYIFGDKELLKPILGDLLLYS